MALSPSVAMHVHLDDAMTPVRIEIVPPPGTDVFIDEIADAIEFANAVQILHTGHVFPIASYGVNPDRSVRLAFEATTT
jgi:hypothetical protein